MFIIDFCTGGVRVARRVIVAFALGLLTTSQAMAFPDYTPETRTTFARFGTCEIGILVARASGIVEASVAVHRIPFAGHIGAAIAYAGGSYWYQDPDPYVNSTLSVPKPIITKEILESCGATVDRIISQNGADNGSYANDEYIGITFYTIENNALFEYEFAAKGAAETSSKVLRIDYEKPVIQQLSDVIVYTDDNSRTAVATWTEPTVTDNVGITSITSTHNSGAVFDIQGPHLYGRTSVSYFAEDYGPDGMRPNETKMSFTVFVRDGGVPTITDIPDITRNNTFGTTTASVVFSTTADDAVEVTVPTVYKLNGTVITSPHLFPIGESVVTIDASDAAGK